MIRFRKNYKRPSMNNKYSDNYFTERYKQNIIVQGQITNIQYVYKDDDVQNNNPILRLEICNVRSAYDGEWIRAFLVVYPDQEQYSRLDPSDGDIRIGDWVEFDTIITILQKCASAQMNGDDFVKNHLPDVMPFIERDGIINKIDKKKIQKVKKGVLSKYEIKVDR